MKLKELEKVRGRNIMMKKRLQKMVKTKRNSDN